MPQPTYLSIDKDVFAPEVARTNWDQGRFRLAHASAVIDSLRGGLVGSDITGEVSHYRYRQLVEAPAGGAGPSSRRSTRRNWPAGRRSSTR